MIDLEELRMKIIKQGYIKYADGRVMKTLYSYEEKTGTEKAQELALEKAKEWLPTAKALRAKGLSQRAIARELQEKGFKVGKTSVQQYQKRGLL
jgi:hypothetical protein